MRRVNGLALQVQLELQVVEIHHHGVDRSSHLVANRRRHHVLDLALCVCKLEPKVECPVPEHNHGTGYVLIYHVDDMETYDFAVL